MNSDTGSVLAGFKGRMQALRDELDNLKDDYDAKCKECEALKEEKNQYDEEVASLKRTLQMLDEKLESIEERLDEANSKFEMTSQTADESERIRGIKMEQETQRYNTFMTKPQDGTSTQLYCPDCNLQFNPEKENIDPVLYHFNLEPNCIYLNALIQKLNECYRVHQDKEYRTLRSNRTHENPDSAGVNTESSASGYDTTSSDTCSQLFKIMGQSAVPADRITDISKLDPTMCTKCGKNNREMLNLKCGHLVYCLGCSQLEPKICSVCRKPGGHQIHLSQVLFLPANYEHMLPDYATFLAKKAAVTLSPENLKCRLCRDRQINRVCRHCGKCFCSECEAKLTDNLCPFCRRKRRTGPLNVSNTLEILGLHGPLKIARRH